jgi:hypothetical protein
VAWDKKDSMLIIVQFSMGEERKKEVNLFSSTSTSKAPFCRADLLRDDVENVKSFCFSCLFCKKCVLLLVEEDSMETILELDGSLGTLLRFFGDGESWVV